MDRRESLKDVLLRATKIYSPEHLVGREFLFPVEIVLSIIRGFNIKEWLMSLKGEDRVVKYLEDVKYLEGLSLEESTSYLCESVRWHVPITICNPNDIKSEGRVKEFMNDVATLLLGKDLLGNPAVKSWWNLTISEIVDNIREHSQAEKCIILGQRWEYFDSWELVMYDNGVGFSGSLGGAYNRYYSHEEAMYLVIKQQKSAKKREKGVRGTGIKTIRNLITKIPDIKGELILMSGNVACYITYGEPENEQFWIFPLRCIKGTLVAIRINNYQAFDGMETNAIYDVINEAY